LAALGRGLDVGLCFCFDGAEVGDVAVEVTLVFAEETVAFTLLGERSEGRERRGGCEDGRTDLLLRGGSHDVGS